MNKNDRYAPELLNKHVRIKETGKTGILDTFDGYFDRPYCIVLDDKTADPVFYWCNSWDVEVLADQSSNSNNGD